jgi:citrate lyase beta subunit
MVVRITSRHSTTGKQHLSSLIRWGRYRMVVRITSRHSTTGKQHLSSLIRGGRYCMVVRITPSYAIRAHITTKVMSLNPAQARCTRYNIMLNATFNNISVIS